MRRMNGLGVFLCAALLLGNKENLSAQEEPFYRGKTIKIVVGFTSGGFYDRWSRLLAPSRAEIYSR